MVKMCERKNRTYIYIIYVRISSTSPHLFLAYCHFSLGFFLLLLLLVAVVVVVQFFFLPVFHLLFYLFFFLPIYILWCDVAWLWVFVLKKLACAMPCQKNRAPFSDAFHNFEKPSDTFTKLPPQAMRCSVSRASSLSALRNSTIHYIDTFEAHRQNATTKQRWSVRVYVYLNNEWGIYDKVK